MRVERLRAILVRDDDIVAVAAVPSAPACDDDGTACGRMNGSPARSADVNAVSAVDALCDAAARQRIAVVNGYEGASSAIEEGRRKLQTRRRYFAARDDNGRADSERRREVKTVELRDFFRIGAILLRERFKRVAFHDGAFNARYRQDNERVTWVHVSRALEVVRPDNGVYLNAEKICD